MNEQISTPSPRTPRRASDNASRTTESTDFPIFLLDPVRSDFILERMASVTENATSLSSRPISSSSRMPLTSFSEMINSRSLTKDTTLSVNFGEIFFSGERSGVFSANTSEDEPDPASTSSSVLAGSGVVSSIEFSSFFLAEKSFSFRALNMFRHLLPGKRQGLRGNLHPVVQPGPAGTIVQDVFECLLPVHRSSAALRSGFWLLLPSP
ncbi:MAG: hypothetical protein BWY05_01141 [Euryarchaeota archaeon ADurb.Bin165]|nr:MAG: hypothetical protein BWY05_01141 [Euryarchaeota archaeon ADurb.Bin165]